MCPRANGIGLRKMDTTTVIVVGLVVEIVGAFFLSVEAIKLENFRSIRDNVFKHIHHATKSPKLVIIDDDEDPNERANRIQEVVDFNEGVWGARHPKLFLLLHYVAGAILLVVIDYFADWYLWGKAVEGT